MCPGFLEQPVQVEGDPRQVAQVFQDGEGGEEDRHGRQHDADHPGEPAVSAVPDKASQPPGHIQTGEQCLSPIAYGEQDAGNRIREDVSAADGQPDDGSQQQQHDRQPGQRRGDQAVDLLVEVIFLLGAGLYRPAGNALRFGVQ